MTFRRLSYFVAAAPLAVFAGVRLVDYISPAHAMWETRGFLSLPVGFLALHLFGIWFYLPFAAVAGIVSRRISSRAHRQLTCLSPFAFALWVLVLLTGVSLLFYRDPVTARDLGDLALISGSALAIGYVYVALLFLLWRLLPARLRAEEPAA